MCACACVCARERGRLLGPAPVAVLAATVAAVAAAAAALAELLDADEVSSTLAASWGLRSRLAHLTSPPLCRQAGGRGGKYEIGSVRMWSRVGGRAAHYCVYVGHTAALSRCLLHGSCLHQVSAAWLHRGKGNGGSGPSGPGQGLNSIAGTT